LKATINASITDIAQNHFAKRHKWLLFQTGDINLYRVNEQERYQTQVLQIFLTIKMLCSGRHAKAYTVPVAVLTFKVIQIE